MKRVAPVLILGLLTAGCGGTAQKSVQCAIYPSAGSSCRSPDGAWSVKYNPGSLLLMRVGRSEARAYQSRDSCCTYITWAEPHTLLFDDDYRVMRLDPVTRKHTMIASWSDFVVSPDGRWIAGWDFSSPEEAETAGVLSVDGQTCLVVPHTSHQSDEASGFTQDSKDVIVKRWRFVPNNFRTGSPNLVQYAISSLPASKHC